MPRSYASQFRAMVIEQVRNGRRVADVAANVEVPETTVIRWVRQDKIDRGEMPGTSSQESTEAAGGQAPDRRARGRARHRSSARRNAFHKGRSCPE